MNVCLIYVVTVIQFRNFTGRLLLLMITEIRITCTYDGVPQLSVLWYTALTGDTRVNIPASDADYVVTITPTETVLTIRDVDSEDAGTYGCEATNTVPHHRLLYGMASKGKSTNGYLTS